MDVYDYAIPRIRTVFCCIRRTRDCGWRLTKFALGVRYTAHPTTCSPLSISISLFHALAENIAMLEQVERSALNGSLAESLGKDVIGWHVTNQQQTDRAARIKRAPYYGWRYTATVEPYRVAPTKTSKVTKTDAADAGVGPGQRIVPRCR